MDNIFIDTSVFEANNFLEGQRMNEIFKLSEEGHIKIILPEITYNEIKHRGLANIRAALAKHKKFRDEARILRNVPSQSERFREIDEKECTDEFVKILHTRLKQAKCAFVSYPTVNIKDVFDKYFNDQFPFSKGNKKHEFPDAFALLAVEEWCKTNATKCKVFSKDKDLLAYKSEHLTIVESYESYLDDLLRNIEISKKREARLAHAKELYDSHKDQFENDIKDWLFNQLDDFNIYDNHTDFEIHDVYIEDHDAMLLDFQIVNVTDDYIRIEAQAELYYTVNLEIDDENSGWYDSEEKEWHHTETEVVTVEDSQIVSVSIKVEIPLVGDEYADIEIEEINYGKKLNV